MSDTQIAQKAREIGRKIASGIKPEKELQELVELLQQEDGPIEEEEENPRPRQGPRPTEIKNDEDLLNFLEGLQPLTEKGRVIAFSEDNYSDEIPKPKGVRGHLGEHNEYYYNENDDEWR